ncbi:MAG: hypothetical protein PW786_05535 [Arachidicoccus sp.]|nr:hypothetical protein [Arachidicoccus sp.]
MSNEITLPGYDLKADKSGLKPSSIAFDLADTTIVTGYSSAITPAVRNEFVGNFTTPLIRACTDVDGRIDPKSEMMNRPVSVTFGKQALLLLLSQKGAEGLRFWFAVNCEENSTLVVEAVSDELLGNGTHKYAKGIEGSSQSPLLFEVAPPTTLGDYLEMKKESNEFSLNDKFQNETVNVLFEEWEGKGIS